MRTSRLFAILLLSTILCAGCQNEPASKNPTAAPTALLNEQNDTLNEEVAQLPILLRTRNFAELDKRIAKYLNNNKMDINGITPLSIAYGSFDFSENLLPDLNAWCEASPSSQFPLTLRGEFYISYAWKARGGRWAKEVPEYLWPVFEERLKLAKADLQEACMLSSRDPNAATSMLTICKALDLPREEMEKYFQQAIKIDPSFYLAYEGKLEYLKPKWGGSITEMLSFGKECVQKAPAGSRVEKILLDVHREWAAPYNSGPSWWKWPNVWADVESIYRKRLSAPGPYRLMDANHLAHYALLCEKYDVAAEMFDKVGCRWYEGAFPKLEDFLKNRGTAYSKIGRPTDKRNPYDWFIEESGKEIGKNPNNAFLYYSRGLAWQGLENSKKAVADLKKAVKMRPGNVGYRGTLADIYISLGKNKAAMEQQDAILKIYPATEWVLNSKAHLLGQMKKPEKVLELYQAALKYQPEWAGAWYNIGEYYVQKKDMEKAMEAWRHALRLHHMVGDPEKENIIYLIQHMREYYESQRRYKDLLDLYKEELKCDPNNHLVCNNYAWMLATCEDQSFRNMKEALPYAENAVKLTKFANTDYMDTLALLYEENKMPEQAIGIDKVILHLRPGDTRATERIARCQGSK